MRFPTISLPSPQVSPTLCAWMHQRKASVSHVGTHEWSAGAFPIELSTSESTIVMLQLGAGWVCPLPNDVEAHGCAMINSMLPQEVSAALLDSIGDVGRSLLI